MSFFGFKRTETVWGLQRSIAMQMIDWWIEQAGHRPYLVRIKTSYEHGYNHGDLTALTDEEEAELRGLVQSMLETGYESRLGLTDMAMAEVRHRMLELRDLLDADLVETPFERTRNGPR